MAYTVNEISIRGMKKADFVQLQEIFNSFKDSGVYWDRKDYFDKRMDRLDSWLETVNYILEDSDTRIG